MKIFPTLLLSSLFFCACTETAQDPSNNPETGNGNAASPGDTKTPNGAAASQPAGTPASKPSGGAGGMAMLDSMKFDHFGKGVTKGDTVDVAAVLANPASFVGKTVRLEGPVNAVCEKAGCWLKLGSRESAILVDTAHAFVVPTSDILDRSAIAEGEVKVIEKDGKKKVEMLSTGVALRKAP